MNCPHIDNDPLTSLNKTASATHIVPLQTISFPAFEIVILLKYTSLAGMLNIPDLSDPLIVNPLPLIPMDLSITTPSAYLTS